MAATDKKEKTYRRIKIAGALSLLPFVLVSGALAGFILGDYLRKKLNAPDYIFTICITVGFIAGAMETVRIIKFALKSQAKE